MREHVRLPPVGITTFKKILCPLDFSEPSKHALEYATMLSNWYGASLTALQVVGLPASPVPDVAVLATLTPADLEAHSRDLRQFVEVSARGDCRANAVVRQGAVVNEILAEAQTLPADLIVMGTHGLGGVERFVLGSVTETILRKAPCPVFTVPRGSVSAPLTPGPFRTILVPVDFSPLSLDAVSLALSLAEESGKKLILLYVHDWPAERSVLPAVQADLRRTREAAVRELHAIIPPDARQWCECAELTATGHADEEILRVAGANSVDLIVMGVHSKNSINVAVFGSTVNQVVRAATCPVLTVRR